jgi:TM2 domain-containing membrane protein YozV/DNA-directed RNA polymerase subunit M/transcription elongation factor TFIIS
MAIAVHCPSCSARLDVSDDLAGKIYGCPSCGEEMKIPDSEPSEPTPSSRPISATKFCHKCGESIRKKAKTCPECGVKQPEGRSKRNDPLLRQANSQKMAAGLCAIFLGAFGVHKFILGMNRQGILLLLVTVLSCGVAYGVTHVIGIVEGIIYLTKTDEEFHELYIVEKKEWF